jgi:Ca2+-dependent lipid-binding protein
MIFCLCVRRTLICAFHTRRNKSASTSRMATPFSLVIIEARNLIAADRSGKSDPYVKFFVDGKANDKWKTKKIKQNLNPYWNETFQLTADKPLEKTTKILFKVFDYDRLKSDDPLGTVEFSTTDLPKLGSDFWLTLTGSSSLQTCIFPISILHLFPWC